MSPSNDQIQLVLGAGAHASDALGQLLESSGDLHGTAVLLPPGSTLDATALPCRTETLRDVVPIGSVLEEAAFAMVHDARTAFRLRLSGERIHGVPWADELETAVGLVPSTQVHLAFAARQLLTEGHHRVFVALDGWTIFQTAILHEAIRCGLAAAGAEPLLFMDGEFVRHRAPMRRTGEVPPPEDLHRLPPGSRLPLTNRTGPPMLLLVSAEPLYLRNVVAIARAVTRRHPTATVLSSSPQIQEAYRAQGLDSTLLRDPDDRRLLRPRRVAASLVSFVQRFADDVQQRLDDRGSGTLDDFGQGCYDQVHHACFTQPELLRDRLLERACEIGHLEVALRTLRPGALYVAPPSTPLHRAAQHLAAQHDLPVVTSVFASISARVRDFEAYADDVADIVTLIGPEQEAAFLDHGYRSDQLVAVGQPELDGLVTRWSTESARSTLTAAHPGLGPDDKLLVSATSSIDLPQELVWLERLARHATARGDAAVVIKLHPAIDAGPYEDLVGRYSDLKIFLSRSEDLEPYLVASAVVLTDVSHAGRLAVLCHKPLITVDLSRSGRDATYADAGVAMHVTDLAALPAAVDVLLDDDDVRAQLSTQQAEFVLRHLTSDDGLAAERVADVLDHAADRNPIRL